MRHICAVSILISVDSGLIRDSMMASMYVLLMFQSLFQWIPVLYMNLSDIFILLTSSFNPYFSGFRSYTSLIIMRRRDLNGVSILISVDSGLIHV